MGRPLVSSETLTWLRENFRESPAAAKPQLDRLFAAGINHIFYHGTVYSPADAAWPGWFFYASTQLKPTNPLWDDFGAMHAYVARVQSVLQAGEPDNDMLLYWPFDDMVDHGTGLMEQYGVHENKWLIESAAGRTGRESAAGGLRVRFHFRRAADAPESGRQGVRRSRRGPIPGHRGSRHTPHVRGNAGAAARAREANRKGHHRIVAAGRSRLLRSSKRAAPNFASSLTAPALTLAVAGMTSCRR